LLGPTAVGKTAIGVLVADHFGWDIISADSRQVYKGLDIGSGKDLAEYVIGAGDAGGERRIAHHLIDIVGLDYEYSVYDFQKDFYVLFDSMTMQERMPFIVGGTGMYVDSVVRGSELVEVPEDKLLRSRLEAMSLEELARELRRIKPNLHNTSDLADRERAIHAIEIQTYMQSEEYRSLKARSGTAAERHGVRPLVLGTTLPREKLREGISRRLAERMDSGLIEEVEGLHGQGVSWERLERLGLEYRFVSEYLEGKIASREELFSGLEHAIHRFAKRQETWFRGMERKGVEIHWLPEVTDKAARARAAIEIIDLFGNLGNTQTLTCKPLLG
ncbi:MAG: tRNA (adenosine(37)-N6)-dimethylallyltransferase MiaA, partial [Treponema sp.]|nr:tRNA (adenosine(37)-N6)-dimethylallyltransferase MiaA [Treponema sp.]